MSDFNENWTVSTNFSETPYLTSDLLIICLAFLELLYAEGQTEYSGSTDISGDVFISSATVAVLRIVLLHGVGCLFS